MTTTTITSAATSRNTLPHGIRYCIERGILTSGMRVLDFGGGRFEKATNFAQEHGVTLRVYDKYNRTHEHNVKVLMDSYGAITCNNVLNVLPSIGDILSVIEGIKGLARRSDNCPVYFTVYEGDRTEVGKVTRDGYQQNKPVGFYRAILRDHFHVVEQRGKVLVCGVPQD